ncbi:aminopeptidase [candidate division KSB1 bacterium]|nr:aminopeptidase [candidate division KSB1 bacterium]
MIQLEKAIEKTLYDCLRIRAKESVLILVDEFNREIGQRFLKKALSKKTDAALLEIGNINNRNPEPSPTIQKIAKQVSAVIVLTGFPLLHAKFKNSVCHNGGRILFLNDFSDESFLRTINTNFETVENKSRRFADLFSISKEIQLTTQAGTDLTFRIARHKGAVHSFKVKEPGSFSFLPAGEASVTPDSGTSQGIIVVDGSIPFIGKIENPIEIHVKDGSGYKLTGKEEAEKLRKILKPFGKPSRNIAEFGIGTNPNAILTGESIEDEKVLGTAHIALGNPNFEGGSLKNYLHLDLILKKPTVKMDGHLILENGKMVV